MAERGQGADRPPRARGAFSEVSEKKTAAAAGAVPLPLPPRPGRSRPPLALSHLHASAKYVSSGLGEKVGGWASMLGHAAPAKQPKGGTGGMGASGRAGWEGAPLHHPTLTLPDSLPSHVATLFPAPSALPVHRQRPPPPGP